MNHKDTIQCELVCMKCGDASKTQVNIDILEKISRLKTTEVQMEIGCAICQHTRFMLIPPTSYNMIDEMLQGIET